MDDYIVKITPQAEGQIQETIHYIAHELKSPEAALRLLDALENAFASLGHFPQRIALTDGEPWRTNGIRRLPVKNFFVYFWINEDDMEVHVTAMIYGKRDQLRQLSQMDME